MHAHTGPDEVRAFVRAHLRALRAHEHYGRAKIFLLPEANAGNQAQHISQDLIASDGVTIVCQTEHAYGVYTNPTYPQAYVYRLQRRLYQDALHFAASMVSANPFQRNMTGAERAKRAHATLVEQLKAFQRTPLVPTSLLAKTRYAYSGRANPDGRRSTSKKDDVVLALLIGVFWSDQHKAGKTARDRGVDNQLVSAYE